MRHSTPYSPIIEMGGEEEGRGEVMRIIEFVGAIEYKLKCCSCRLISLQLRRAKESAVSHSAVQAADTTSQSILHYFELQLADCC